MLYYLTVNYDIADLSLSEASSLHGPYATPDQLADALAANLGARDLETSETISVTLLETLADGSLVSRDTYIAPSVCNNPATQRAAALGNRD